jgi:hypothetical protein
MENESVIKTNLNLSSLNINFSSKPLIFGGMAMEYYSLREHGGDIDMFVTDKDYKTLAESYPDKRIDIWGNLAVILEKYSFNLCVCHMDYHFYAVGAVEYEDFKVISFDRLYFMAASAMRSEPNVKKRVDDFELVYWAFYDRYKNPEYIKYCEEHRIIYQNVPNGTIYGGKYPNIKP